MDDVIPDLAGYGLHRVIDDIDILGDGVAVPGLCAEFHRREDGAQTQSVGRYRFAGREVLMAWGLVGDPSCAWHTVREPDGRWSPPRPGCPQVTLLREDHEITGIMLTGDSGPVLARRADALAT